MDNYAVIGILGAIILFALGSLVKRKNRKGCCGSGSDYKPRKKKLKKTVATKTFRVEGMHCEKCANRITEAVNDIAGVAATVDLKKGIVTVSYEQDVPDAEILAKIQRLGYAVEAIEE